jgi:hypothetical protein
VRLSKLSSYLANYVFIEAVLSFYLSCYNMSSICFMQLEYVIVVEVLSCEPSLPFAI